MTKTKRGTCPSCGFSGTFPFLGDQTWPPAIAEKLGFPARLALWTCPMCHTTISDPNLRPAKAEEKKSTGVHKRVAAR